MANEVQVQSGVGLGIKIFIGFILGGMLCFGGTCVACTGCAALGVGAAGVANQTDAGASGRPVPKVDASIPPAAKTKAAKGRGFE